MNIEYFEKKSFEVFQAQEKLKKIIRDKKFYFIYKVSKFFHAIYRGLAFQIWAPIMITIIVQTYEWVNWGGPVNWLKALVSVFIIFGSIASAFSFLYSFDQYKIKNRECVWDEEKIELRAEKVAKFLLGEYKHSKNKVKTKKPLTEEQILRQFIKENKIFVGGQESLKDEDFKKGLTEVL